jgi:NTE family protein
VAGASAGAIVGALVAAGYSGAELRDIMTELDYIQFRDPGPLDEHLGLSLIFEQGIFKGNYLGDFLGTKLAAKGPSRRRCCPRRIARFPPTSNTGWWQWSRRPACLRRVGGIRCHPQPPMPPPLGLRALPSNRRGRRPAGRRGGAGFHVHPVLLRAGARGRRRRQPLLVGGRRDAVQLPHRHLRPYRRPHARWPTIGIKLSSQPTRADGRDKPIHGTISMAEAPIAAMSGFHDQMHLEDPATVDRTIFVDTTGVTATDFDLNKGDCGLFGPQRSGCGREVLEGLGLERLAQEVLESAIIPAGDPSDHFGATRRP